ncbi:dynactin subunit 1-like isoform X4 [Ostrea edulis]|uniref:dynactin subunit 1-like isoform X4 n=1 Tax=Ostrea edulis TaxID=37623 RepID=UPI0024AFDCE8|nr:dynactin subunit 1-like isoform X4 [Ostrea edulis]
MNDEGDELKMADGKSVKVGTRVELTDKGLLGTVAYVGTTLFSSGKWIGVILDDEKGKNNGTVQGKTYFTCNPNHGIFVRQSQITVLDEGTGTPASIPASKLPSSSTVKKFGLRPPSYAGKRFRQRSENLVELSDTPKKAPSVPSDLSKIASSSGLSTPKGRGSMTRLPGPKSGRDSSSRESTPSNENLADTQKGKTKGIEKKTDSVPDLTSMTRSLDSSLTTAGSEDKLSNLQTQQEMEGLKAEIKDLNEKLETLKIKRAEDKTKLKEFEKAKIQLQQLQEYKSKMQETQKDLQQQLQTARKEAKDIQESFDRYKDEMSDLAETVEIATLDKEMAEEKAEGLQQEVDSLRERAEELNMDLEILKNEISEKGTDGVASEYELKQRDQQIERLREALVKMRDLSNQEKQEVQRLTKVNEKFTAEITNLKKDKERFAGEVEQLSQQMIDLKEQVDAALGAEEMVETLTDRNLALEEKIQELEEEKADLEALHDMNEELQETAREAELELREELDLATGRANEFKRKLDATAETFADYEATISKFRELVSTLQDTIRDMRSRQAETEQKSETTPTIEVIDFKTKFAETKAYAKTIDMELRKLEVQQANRHVGLLQSFMGDNFMNRGGDHDAILVLLMIPRIISKAELLASQVKDKFELTEEINRDSVLKSHSAEQSSFSSSLVLLLNTLQGIMRQYDYALKTCNVDLLLKIGTLLPEISAHETSVDYFIELLRKDQLDETISLDLLEKSISYFQQLHSVHLAQEKVDCTALMADQVRLVQSATECVGTDITRLRVLLMPGQEKSEIAILFKDLENCNSDTKMCARKIKRRLPQGDGSATPLSFGKEVQDLLMDCSKNITMVTRTLHFLTAGAMQQAALMTDSLAGGKLEDYYDCFGEYWNSEGLMPKKMEEIAFQISDKVYGKDDTGPYECLRMSFGKVVGTMNKLANAMENGEYDFDGTHDKTPVSPVVLRAKTVKAQISEMDLMKHKMEAKEESVKDLKLQVMKKQEEVSEMQVRIGLLEKKLENATKDGDSKLDKVQRKHDELLAQLRKKEKEFEETMDALQQDIDTLEQEKIELKERLKILSKKTLIEGITRQATQPASSPGSPVHSGGGFPLQESPFLIQQMTSLREALKSVKDENIRLKSDKIKEQMAKLPPLRVPKKSVVLSAKSGAVTSEDLPEGSPGKDDLTNLRKDTAKLLAEVNTMCACPRVIDITKRKPGHEPLTESSNPARELVARTARLTLMERKTQQLQVQITNLLAANRTGGQVRTDLSTFPTPEFARMLHEKSAESQLIGRISIPTKSGQGEIIPLNLQPTRLKEIHQVFVH